jgi:hypothetical protein
VRVDNNLAEANVSLTQEGALFGKISGTSGVTWRDPNAQVGGGM